MFEILATKPGVSLAAVRGMAPPSRKVPAPSGVRIVISDDGPGIQEQIQERVFDPFFSTKEEKGTGLGLWVAKGIISKHDGSVRLRTSTTQGRTGTIVSVFLPEKASVALQTHEQ